MSHHPVDGQVEEQRRHTTTLPHAGLHTEAGVAVAHSALEVVVEALDDQDNFLRDSVHPESSPETVSVDAVKGLLKIYVVDVQLPLPFRALLDISQGEDLVCASSSFPESRLFFPELLVHCLRDPPDDECGEDLGGNRQDGDSSPVVTVAQGSFLGDLDDDSLRPVFR